MSMTEQELFLQEVGRRIAERRKQLGMTQEMLAERGDMTPQFVSYAEAGKRAMRPENLLKLASSLGVSADYLLTGDIIDKDLLLLSEKLRQLTPEQVRIVECIIDECVRLYAEGAERAQIEIKERDTPDRALTCAVRGVFIFLRAVS